MWVELTSKQRQRKDTDGLSCCKLHLLLFNCRISHTMDEQMSYWRKTLKITLENNPATIQLPSTKIHLCHTLGNLHVLYVYQFLVNSLLLFVYIYFNTEVNNNAHLPEVNRIMKMWSA